MLAGRLVKGRKHNPGLHPGSPLLRIDLLDRLHITREIDHQRPADRLPGQARPAPARPAEPSESDDSASLPLAGLRVDGKTSTRPFFQIPNPLADSYDFIRGDLGALTETAQGVDLGSGRTTASSLPIALTCMSLGCAAVYSTLFATGAALYGFRGYSALLAVVAIACTTMITILWRRL